MTQLDRIKIIRWCDELLGILVNTTGMSNKNYAALSELYFDMIIRIKNQVSIKHSELSRDWRDKEVEDKRKRQLKKSKQPVRQTNE